MRWLFSLTITVWFAFLPLVTNPPESTMTSSLFVVVPEATTNLITNPSVENAITGYTLYNGSVVTRSNLNAARGAYGVRVQPAATVSSGVYYNVSLTSGVSYTWSVDVAPIPNVTMALRVVDPAPAQIAAATFTTTTSSWTRQSVSFTATTSGTYQLILGKSSSTSTVQFFTDGWQVEANAYGTTYIDGDMDGGAWAGVRHASVSTRSAQSRAGGRVRDLYADYGFMVQAMPGAGVAPLQHSSTAYGQLDGSEFQRTIVQERPFTIAGVLIGTSSADLHAKRLALFNTLRKDLVSPEQPVRFWYTGGIGTVEIAAVYDAGMDLPEDGGWTQKLALRFIADDPYWHYPYTTVKSLAVNDTITDADYILERNTNGVWQALAGGLNGVVYAALYAPDGYLYVGGDFTTAYNGAGTTSPVTVNRIARWNGSAWSAVGAGVNAGVRALALDPNGILYIGGLFTDAAYPGLAKWNGSALSAVVSAASTKATVQALAYNPHNGRLYIGGLFTSWGGVAGRDYIAAYNVTSNVMEAVGTANNAVYSLSINRSGSIAIGGLFTTINATSYNHVVVLSTAGVWSPVYGTAGAIGVNNTVFALAYDTANTLYIGGSFTDAAYPYIAKLVGTSLQALSTGLTAQVQSIFNAPNTSWMAIGGSFTSAGGLTLTDRIAVWTGSTWVPIGIDLPGAASVWASAYNPDGRIAIGFDTSGTATTTNVADTTVTVVGSRAAAPAMTFTGPMVLQSVQNTTTKKALYFNNLTLQAGEYAVLNLDPSEFFFHSNMRPNLNNYLLPGSDQTSWRLQPGDNTVVIKTATTTGSSLFWVTWAERFWSVDN